MIMTAEEKILDLYARYRRTGWRFTRLSWRDGRWGIEFRCAGNLLQIRVENGMVKGLFFTDLNRVISTTIAIQAPEKPLSFETLYRRLDKKAGVKHGR